MCSNWVIFRAAWAGAQFPEMHIERNFGRSCGTSFLMSFWTSEYCLNCGLKKLALMCGLYFSWADGNYMWRSCSAEWKSAQWALSENTGLIWEVCSLVGMLSSNLRGFHFCMWVLTFCSSGYAFKLQFERGPYFSRCGFLTFLSFACAVWCANYHCWECNWKLLLMDKTLTINLVPHNVQKMKRYILSTAINLGVNLFFEVDSKKILQDQTRCFTMWRDNLVSLTIRIDKDCEFP